MHTFSSALDGFILALQDLNLSPRTISRYRGVLLDFQAFLGPDTGPPIHVQDIGKEHVVGYLRHNGDSAKTRNIKLSAIRRFFRYLEDEELVVGNPASRVAFAKESERLPVFLSWDEYLALLKVVINRTYPTYRVRNLAIVVTLFNTGLRISELTSLNLASIDWSNRTFVDVPLKGGHMGTIVFNEVVEKILRGWLDDRRGFGAQDGEDALFLSKLGTRQTPRSIEHAFVRYSHLMGIQKKITPHVLRHGLATHLASQGHDIHLIGQVLNHRSLNATKVYIHLADDSKRKALEGLVDKRVLKILDRGMKGG